MVVRIDWLSDEFGCQKGCLDESFATIQPSFFCFPVDDGLGSGTDTVKSLRDSRECSLAGGPRAAAAGRQAIRAKGTTNGDSSDTSPAKICRGH